MDLSVVTFNQSNVDVTGPILDPLLIGFRVSDWELIQLIFLLRYSCSFFFSHAIRWTNDVAMKHSSWIFIQIVPLE